MPIRSLMLFPDPRLRQRAEAIDHFGPEWHALADDVRDTLTAVSAIGLTATHIGVLRRLVVVRMTPDEPTHTYLNPIVTWASSETETNEEGSVSMPGMREKIARPARIQVQYHDLGGERRTADVSGFAAAVLQHEIDQLDGIFWIDRLSRLKRERLLAKFDKAGRKDTR